MRGVCLKHHPIIKFMIVGCINTIVALSIVFILLDFVNWPYWPATFVGTVIGACINYLLNKRFTFQSDAPLWKSFKWFIAVFLVCYFVGYQLGLTMAYFILNHWHILPIAYHHEAAVLIGSELYTISNYLGQRYLVFPHRSHQKIQFR